MNPTTNIIALSMWQKTQAAMLYHFASLEYLRGLQRMVAELVDRFVDPVLKLSIVENRDLYLSDPRWGTRNTTANWANNAWPFLKDYQLSLAKDIAVRAFEQYGITDTNNCFRGISEISMQWATVEEEEKFNGLVREISDYAYPIDQTLDTYHNSLWSDYGFAAASGQFLRKHPEIPKFRIRTDVIGESGKVPIRTGVYVTQDDPNAALQFAWTGNGDGKLRPAKTFSNIGLAALKAVGRKDLWLDDQKMFDFAIKSPDAATFRPTIYMLGSEHRNFASGAVADEAFVDQPCKWYFVEMINGEFENVSTENISVPLDGRERVIGGDKCQRSGFYFTPAVLDSRQWINAGQNAPKYDAQYGETIWQWDPRQD